MGMSQYMQSLRAVAGSRLILVPASAVFVFDRLGRTLLVRDASTGLWGNPGGAIDPGESPVVAAVRELREETGLVASQLHLLGAYGGSAFEVTYPGGDRSSYVVVSYGTFEFRGALLLQKDEVDDAAWVDRRDVGEFSLSPAADLMAGDAFLWAAHRM